MSIIVIIHVCIKKTSLTMSGFRPNYEPTNSWPWSKYSLKYTFMTFPKKLEFHNPNWRTHIFFRGVGQPPSSCFFHVIIPGIHHSHSEAQRAPSGSWIFVGGPNWRLQRAGLFMSLFKSSDQATASAVSQPRTSHRVYIYIIYVYIYMRTYAY